MGIETPSTPLINDIPPIFKDDFPEIKKYNELCPNELKTLLKEKGRFIYFFYRKRIIYLIKNNKSDPLFTFLNSCGLDKFCKMFVNFYTEKQIDKTAIYFKIAKKNKIDKPDEIEQVCILWRLYIDWLKSKPSSPKNTAGTLTKTKQAVTTPFLLEELFKENSKYSILLSTELKEKLREGLILKEYEQRINYLLKTKLNKKSKYAQNLIELFGKFGSEAICELFVFFFQNGSELSTSQDKNNPEYKKKERQILSKLYAFQVKKFKKSEPKDKELVNELFKSYVSWLRERDNPQKPKTQKPQTQKSQTQKPQPQKPTPRRRNSELSFPLPSESEIKKFGILIPESEILTNDYYLSENRDLITWVEVLSTSWNRFIKKLYKKNEEGGARESIDGRGRKTIDIEKSWEFLLRKIKAKGIYEKKMKAGKLINIIFANDPNFEWEYDKDNNVIKIKDKKSELIFRYILYDIIRSPSNDLESTEEILNNLILLTEVTKNFPKMTIKLLGDNVSGDRWQQLLNLCEKARQKLKEKSSSPQEESI